MIWDVYYEQTYLATIAAVDRAQAEDEACEIAEGAEDGVHVRCVG